MSTETMPTWVVDEAVNLHTRECRIAWQTNEYWRAQAATVEPGSYEAKVLIMDAWTLYRRLPGPIIR